MALRANPLAGLSGTPFFLPNAPPGSVLAVQGAETVGQKLRRLMAAALRNNAQINPPLSAEPTWGATTAYAVCAHVVQAGKVYVNQAGGTSASTGPSAAGVSTIATADGTCNWSFLRWAETTTTDPAAPALTRAGAGIVSALGHVVSPVDGVGGVGGVPASKLAATPYPFVFNNIFYGGGYAYFGANGSPTMNILSSSLGYTNLGALVSSTLQNGIAAWTPNTPGSNFGSSASSHVIFYTDAQKIDVQMTPTGVSNHPNQLIIGGEGGDRFAQRNTMTQLAAAGTHFGIDFSASAYYGPRKIKLRLWNNPNIANIFTAATDTVWAPTRAEVATVAMDAASIFFGGATFSSTAAGSACNVIADLLGWDNPVDVSMSGGAFASASVAGQSIQQRVADFTWMQPDAIVIMAGYHDIGLTSAAGVLAAMQQFIYGVRNAPGCASTPIIIASCYAALSLTSLALSQQMEGWFQQAITTIADPYTWFIPMSTDPSPWFFGNGYAAGGQQNASGNSDIYIGASQLHPTPLGEQYFGHRFARAIAQVINQIP